MALLELDRDKHGHHVSRVVCDQCGIDGVLPKQLHSTLYKVNRALYYCETHMILAGLRPVTPNFVCAIQKAKEHAMENKPNQY